MIINQPVGPHLFLHRGELKGMVIFFHGLTACPQQYFEVAEKLTEAGWDVFLPTNPGHGMVRGTATPEYAKLPTKANYEAQISHFVKQMNEVARTHPFALFLSQAGQPYQTLANNGHAVLNRVLTIFRARRPLHNASAAVVPFGLTEEHAK